MVVDVDSPGDHANWAGPETAGFMVAINGLVFCDHAIYGGPQNVCMFCMSI